MTLGFTPVDGSGYALDAWGLPQNRIRYAVANATVNGVTNPFTKDRRDAQRNDGQHPVRARLCSIVCRTGTGVTATGCAASTDELSDNAIAVIWSLGENAPTGGAAPHEDKNLNNTRVFVLAPYSTNAGSVFDDQLTWIGPPMVFNGSSRPAASLTCQSGQADRCERETNLAWLIVRIARLHSPAGAQIWPPDTSRPRARCWRALEN